MGAPPTAPAAHLVTIQADPEGRGLLVGHITCEAPPVFVPNMPNVDYALAIDVAQAVVGHKCVNEKWIDDPKAWVPA